MGRDKIISTALIIIMASMIIVFFLFKVFNLSEPTILPVPKVLPGNTVLGIDVSRHQGNINWQKVYNSGKKFAWVKATEGNHYIDPKFSKNMVNGKKAGVVMGAYHFARPCNNISAVQEANHFINVARSYIGSGFLPPALDLENYGNLELKICLYGHYTKSKLTQWVQEWINTVEKATGVTPVIYTTTGYSNYLNNSLKSYRLWIAKPNTKPTAAPTNMGIWNTSWVVKQYSWQGKVSGISHKVDLNIFNGTIDDFNNFIDRDVNPSE